LDGTHREFIPQVQNMPRTQTGDEVLAKYQAAMPGPLGEIFSRLWNEMGTLHDTWQKYQTLYIESEATVDLLNDTAGTFFYELSGILAENVMLHVCRLTDPAVQFGNNNLSIQQLPGNIAYPVFAAHVQSLVNNALANAAFARQWRNKRFAHKDMTTLNGDLPPATIGAIESALGSLRDVMNAVEKHYLKSDTAYLLSTGGPGAVDSLLAFLKLGRDAHEAEIAQWQSRREPPAS
jgi:hypothetical protein